MRKLSWLAAATVASVAVLAGTAAVQAVAAPAADHDSASVLRFSTMAPVTGPYVGATDPIRGIAGGGLPWIITSARGSLRSDGRLEVRVRGLVLANSALVPANLRGVNPFPDFRAVVSCQTIGTGDTASVANVFTGNFRANSEGDSRVDTMISLPHPCIAPIVFVTGPVGVNAWFSVTGS